MDIYEITQLMLVATSGLIFARMGLAVARRIERRPAEPMVAAPAEERIRALEEECALLRGEVAELEERQDFTERLLLRDPEKSVRPERRMVTPR